MFSILKITGASLSPSLLSGDYVLIGKRPVFGRRLKPGDIVAFRHPGYGLMIKRVQTISADGNELYVVGDHPDSIDSRVFGPIPLRSVTGRVLRRFTAKH